MKNCTACNQQIALNVKFCPECGAKQEVQEIKEVVKVEENQPVETIQQVEETNVVPTEKKRFPILYTILCLLTFVGPLHIVLIGLFYLIFGSAAKNISMLIIGSLWSISAIGTAVGTILLMMKRKKGLLVYTINQVVYIGTAIYVAIQSFDSRKFEDIGEAILILLVIPSLIFLGIFWFSKFRKYLTR
ncbi:hypothetical protein H2O64_08820 [Kordia sp. YSTF-M3]|uniref:Zinc-ribbon domain-containing protein n=1 Tax=Kordia aestuariivivens TaxID=2759037 RepID=A0ABR7Q874_9FLAO|nr:hypothetical protein [Kordia aestuariivivens]MBC8754771.1 hypothetical protein [Kordia aestuariivivens]